MTGVLPADAVLPYDFGFIPQTRGGDGGDLNEKLVDQIEHFFVSYNAAKGNSSNGSVVLVRIVRKSSSARA
jgi:inorganic pyrophosphatase